MSAYFFVTIMVFWMVKPIKKGLFLGLYPRDVAPDLELVAKALTVVAAIGVVMLFSFMVHRVGRLRLVGYWAVAFAAVFAACGAAQAEHPGHVTTWTLYIAGDLYTSVFVALFWILLNDSFDVSSARRLFGFMGTGGIAGGVVGSTISGKVATLGFAGVLGGAAALTLLLVGLAGLAHRAGLQPRPDSLTRPSRAERRRSVLEGVRLTLASRYLLGIAALVLLYEFISQIMNYQVSVTAKRELGGGLALTEYWAALGQILNAVSLVVQVVFVGWIHRRFGVTVALLVLPCAILGVSAGFLAVGGLTLAGAMFVADNALGYSIHQTSRELLYVPASPEARTKAKAFIDMLVQRVGKLLATLVAYLFGLVGVRFLSLVTVALTVALVAVVLYVGREFRRQTRAASPGPAGAVDGVAAPRESALLPR